MNVELKTPLGFWHEPGGGTVIAFSVTVHVSASLRPEPPFSAENMHAWPSSVR